MDGTQFCLIVCACLLHTAHGLTDIPDVVSTASWLDSPTDSDVTRPPEISIEMGTAWLKIYNITLREFLENSTEAFSSVLAVYIQKYCDYDTTDCPPDAVIEKQDVIIVEDGIEEDEPNLTVPVYIRADDSTALVSRSVIEGTVETYAAEIHTDFGFKIVAVYNDGGGNKEDGGLADWELALIIVGSILGFVLLVAIIAWVCLRCKQNSQDGSFKWEGQPMELTANGKAVDMQDIIAHTSPTVSGTPTLNNYSNTSPVVKTGHQAPYEVPRYTKRSSTSRPALQTYDNVNVYGNIDSMNDRRYV